MQNSLLLATSLVVETSTSLVDGAQPPYNKLIPGDTIYLKAGTRDYLLIRNFQGSVSKPFIFINKGGVVTIDTNHTYGISIQNCRFFRFTGIGVQNNFYGIEVKRVGNGSGLGIGGMSSDFEVDHISIKDVPIGGLYAKTDPDCNFNTTREKFTQLNTIIHDNYIENAGNEGLYIGSTKYSGQLVKCIGKDTLLMPSMLDGVKVYNNIIKYSGWDGIQVSSAFKNCQVYDNIVLFDSQAEYVNQMSGIILGGGSDCDCYNNYIADGKGDGIENHGLGGKRLFNNIIVNAGVTYAPDETGTTKMKHGIFVSDVSALPDRSFYIQNNTIINPKSDGIRFASVKSKNNLISSNAIIGPGNFDTYEFGNTQFKGVDSYVMIPDKNTGILLKNNYFARNVLNAGLDFDYSLLKNSPLIKAGYSAQPFIPFDFKYHLRTTDSPPSIGAYEYYSLLDVAKPTNDQTLPIAYPNPVKLELFVKFMIDTKSDVTISLYNLVGSQIMVKEQFGVMAGTYSTKIDVQDLSPGLYLYSVRTLDKIDSGKFLKVD
jgi:hypothetical protein